jgi:Secretion system C-terminal sorting domain/PA domain
MTKLYTVIIAFCMMTSGLYAQKPAYRVDTVVLSVYNTSQRFMLYSMPFGQRKPDDGFTAEMVASLDTVNVLREVLDSAGNKVPMWVTEHVCGQVSANVKGKVALLQMNPACDVSTQVLHAQKAGAVTVIMVHTTNNRDSVMLPRQPYADAEQVTIAGYTVRQGIGEKIGLMLPSLVGIKILAANDSSRNDIQNKVTMNPPVSTVQPPSSSEGELVKVVDIGWRLAPNPTTEEITIHYQFAEKVSTMLEIFNEVGQLVTNYELTPAQIGQLVVNVENWRTGTYHVRLRHGTLKEVKRFMVIH